MGIFSDNTDDKKEWTFEDETSPSDQVTSGNVIKDYLDELVLGSDDEGIRVTGDGETTDIGDTSFLDEEIEDQDDARSELNWMQENAPEWFSDWLYEAERPNFGEVDLSAINKDMETMDLMDPSNTLTDYRSDIGRGTIQTGGYMADFWKDLGMMPWRLSQGESWKKQYDRLMENPRWAEEIGYETKYGKKIMDNPLTRMVQEHWLPYLGGGVLGLGMKIPAAGKLLKTAYPMMAALTKGKAMKWTDPLKAIWNPSRWMGGLPKPGSWAFNLGIPYLASQGIKKQKGEPENIFDRAGELFGAVDMPSPISSAYAADVPMDRGYAAGQMPTPVRAPSNRAMMEMANTRRPGPRDDYRGL